MLARGKATWPPTSFLRNFKEQCPPPVGPHETRSRLRSRKQRRLRPKRQLHHWGHGQSVYLQARLERRGLLHM